MERDDTIRNKHFDAIPVLAKHSPLEWTTMALGGSLHLGLGREECTMEYLMNCAAFTGRRMHHLGDR